MERHIEWNKEYRRISELVSQMDSQALRQYLVGVPLFPPVDWKGERLPPLLNTALLLLRDEGQKTGTLSRENWQRFELIFEALHDAHHKYAGSMVFALDCGYQVPPDAVAARATEIAFRRFREILRAATDGAHRACLALTLSESTSAWEGIRDYTDSLRLRSCA